MADITVEVGGWGLLGLVYSSSWLVDVTDAALGAVLGLAEAWRLVVGRCTEVQV